MTNPLALLKRDTVDVVAAKVKEFQEAGELHFPRNYSPDNAMKSAWLILQETKAKVGRDYVPVLQYCTKDSIANALLDMVVQGLNPAKKQGYFIAYGKTLVFQRSYFGTMAVTKRVTGAKRIDAAVIYEGDQVEYEMVNARITHLTHKQKFENINKDKIIGAYATIVINEDDVYHELMTIDEIRKAWNKSRNWSGDSPVEKEGSTHDEFKQEMAKKTVINRACKKFLNSSDDSSLMMQHINNENEIDEEELIEEEIENNANSEVIDVEFNEVNADEEPTVVSEPEEPEVIEEQEPVVYMSPEIEPEQMSFGDPPF